MLLFLGFLALFHIATPALQGQSVKCDPTQMHVFFDFDSDFNGVVYTRDFYKRDSCRTFGNGTRKLSLSIPINVDAVREPFCGVRLNQNKHEFSVQLLVNEMKDILVSGLKEFEVRCAYDLESITVKLPSQNGIHINAIAKSVDEETLELIKGSGSGILPILAMSMREGNGIGGSILQAATIGQDITMDIFLDEPVPYDIFVYNCIAHDGSRWPSGTVTLIDEKGCGVEIDRVTRPPVQVMLDSKGIKHVFLGLRGFQFSSSDVVYFECQVRPCLHKCNVTQCYEEQLSIETIQATNQLSPRFPRQAFHELEVPQSLSLVTKLSMHPNSDMEQNRKDAPSLLRGGDSEHIDSCPKSNFSVTEQDFILNQSAGRISTNQRLDLIEKGTPQLCLPHPVMGVLLFIFISACIVCAGASIVVWRKLRNEKQLKSSSRHQPY